MCQGTLSFFFCSETLTDLPLSIDRKIDTASELYSLDNIKFDIVNLMYLMYLSYNVKLKSLIYRR